MTNTHADWLTNIVSRLAVVSDFVGRLDSGKYALDKDTPAGLRLVMDGCIADLRKIIAADILSAPPDGGR